MFIVAGFARVCDSVTLVVASYGTVYSGALFVVAGFGRVCDSAILVVASYGIVYSDALFAVAGFGRICDSALFVVADFGRVCDGVIYFKASVLYFDEQKIVLIQQNELGEDASVILKCPHTNNKEIWSKTAEETAFLKPFLKSTNSTSFLNGNQLAIIQPYQLGVCLNIDNGEINWSFKPYE